MVKRVIVKDALSKKVVKVFDSVTKAAKFFGVTGSALHHRYKKGLVYDGYLIEYSDEAPIAENFVEKTSKHTLDECELDRERYNIIKYEVKYGHICITPCPFLEAPKPMVGSGKCIRCSRNRGRNRITHEIACSRKRYDSL